MDEKNESGKRRLTPLRFALIQLCVIVYTGSGICMKLAAGHEPMTFWWIFWTGMCVAVLGAYAILWQQIIKRYDLSVAYANRAFAIFWSMLWAVVLFREKVTLGNLLAVAVIFAGIMLVNKDAK